MSVQGFEEGRKKERKKERKREKKKKRWSENKIKKCGRQREVGKVKEREDVREGFRGRARREK